LTTSTTHDPRREIEKLRDHLGSHDGRLAFLIGAGTSAAVRGAKQEALIPTVVELGEKSRDSVAALGDEHAGAYDSIVAECANALARIAAAEETLAREVNVEDVLSSVRTKLTAIGDGDRIAGLDRVQLEQVEGQIRTTIAKAAHPAESRIPKKLPHHDLARWISRLGRSNAVEIFTTNYDTLLERALEDERLPVFDGFVGARQPFFSAVSLARKTSMPGAAWTRLWKLHGSINWHSADFADGSNRIIRGPESDEGELIFPSLHKYDESRKQPYASMLDHLGRLLDHPDGTVLVVLGYSFGDQHINEIVFDALDGRDRAHVFALQFDELPARHQLISRAQARSNLLVYGPETAVVGGVHGPWQLNEQVDERTADLLDVPFDSDAVVDLDAVANTGKFRLGDFNHFAHFLAALTGTDD
jgi:hypothetical protein